METLLRQEMAMQMVRDAHERVGRGGRARRRRTLRWMRPPRPTPEPAVVTDPTARVRVAV
jgi:hypothetical protein